MKTLIFPLIFCLLFLPLLSEGAGLVPCGGPEEPPCNACHLLILAQNILNFAYRIISSIVIIMIVVGGFKMMFAGGNENNIKAAQSTLTSALIGMVIILCSYLIVNTIFWILAQISHTNYDFQWYKIEMNCEKVAPTETQGEATGTIGIGGGGGNGNGGGPSVNWCSDMPGYACVPKEPNVPCWNMNCNAATVCLADSSITHCPENTVCCIPADPSKIVTEPKNPEPPNEGGPCEGGKLMTLCQNYGECKEYPECTKKLHPEYPNSYCSTGDIMTCPNQCIHECVFKDGVSIGCN